MGGGPSSRKGSEREASDSCSAGMRILKDLSPEVAHKVIVDIHKAYGRRGLEEFLGLDPDRLLYIPEGIKKEDLVMPPEIEERRKNKKRGQ